jgi:hypothetical protein
MDRKSQDRAFRSTVDIWKRFNWHENSDGQPALDKGAP